MSDWQPIETAPKDGTVIQLYGEIACEIGGPEGSMSTCNGYWNGSGTDYEGYDWNVCISGPYAYWIKPTHWMPTLDAPK